MSANHMLANVISVFHALLIVFMLCAPFSNVPYFLILHITFSISLMIHWWGNSNMCSLSIIESKLRGLDYTQSFTHKFIAPVYEISNTTWSQVCWVVTVVFMCLSIYNLAYNKKWQKVKQDCQNLENKTISNYMTCILQLFEP